MLQCLNCKSGGSLIVEVTDHQIRLHCTLCGWDKYYTARDSDNKEDKVEEEKRKRIDRDKARVIKDWSCELCGKIIKSKYHTKYCPEHREEIRKQKQKKNMDNFKDRN